MGARTRYFAGSAHNSRRAAANAAASQFVCRTEREIGKERSGRAGRINSNLLRFYGIQRPSDPCPTISYLLLQVWSQPGRATISTFGRRAGNRKLGRRNPSKPIVKCQVSREYCPATVGRFGMSLTSYGEANPWPLKQVLAVDTCERLIRNRLARRFRELRRGTWPAGR